MKPNNFWLQTSQCNHEYLLYQSMFMNRSFGLPFLHNEPVFCTGYRLTSEGWFGLSHTVTVAAFGFDDEGSTDGITDWDPAVVEETSDAEASMGWHWQVVAADVDDVANDLSCGAGYVPIVVLVALQHTIFLLLPGNKSANSITRKPAYSEVDICYHYIHYQLLEAHCYRAKFKIRSDAFN